MAGFRGKVDGNEQQLVFQVGKHLGNVTATQDLTQSVRIKDQRPTASSARLASGGTVSCCNFHEGFYSSCITPPKIEHGT